MSLSNKAGKRFINGVFALTLGTVFVKFLGLALKIPLRDLLGDAGMVYYNNAYNVYATLFAIATAGLPVAVSMLISESRVSGKRKNAKRIFIVALVLFIIVGAFCSSIMLFGADMFEKAYKITDLKYSVIAIAPTMLFICIVSAFRGYFQGYQNMYPTAISEIIEAVGKFILGILLGRWSLSRGDSIPVVAAWATLGISLGVLGGAIFLWITKIFFNPTTYEKTYSDVAEDTSVDGYKTILKSLLMIAVPISLSSSASSISSLIDGMVLSIRLQDSGLAESVSNELIGNLSTCGSPLYNLTLLFVGPITASIVPMLVAAKTEGNKEDQKRIMDGSILMLAVSILPCAVGLGVLSGPVIRLLFGSNTGADAAAPLLSILCVNSMINALLSLSYAILHCYDKMVEPIISILIGAVIKITLLYVLAGNININIYSSPITTVAGSTSILLMDLFFIKKNVDYKPKIFEKIIRPLIASLICGGVAFGVYTLIMKFVYNGNSYRLSELVCVVAAIIFGAIAYLVSIVLLKAFKYEDLLLLPKGKKIADLFDRYGLVKK